MYLKHVFGMFTLQTSAVLLSSLFINLSICILLVNILSFETETPTAWIIMFLFVFFMIVIWLIAFVGAYKESSLYISVAVFLWTPYVIVWIIVVICSLMNTHNKNICIESRCPDVLWLLNCPWHVLPRNQMSGLVYKSMKARNKTQPLYEKTSRPLSNDMRNKSKITRVKKPNTTSVTNIYDDVTLIPTDENVENKFETFKSTDEALGKLSNTNLTQNIYGSKIISIITSLLYTLILLFSWMILISYKKEIQLQTIFTRSTV